MIAIYYAVYKSIINSNTGKAARGTMFWQAHEIRDYPLLLCFIFKS